VNVGVEPFLRISPNLEIGLPISYGAVGSAAETISSSSWSQDYNISVTAISIGLNVRYLFGQEPMQFFVAGGPLVVPMMMSYTSSTGSPASAGGMGFGFGGQIQVGMDYHLNDTFVVGPVVGYQLASASSFTGTAKGQTGEVYIYTSPSAAQWPIIFSGTAGTNYSGAKPLQVDLSGPQIGLYISALF
jgi:hypothetical protein